MKLARINETDIFDVSTEIISYNNNKQHHNVKFGSKLKGLWRVTFGISKSIATVEKNPEPIWLLEDTYTLNPIIKKGKQLKDNRGNSIYYLDKDENISEADKKSILLFVEIPNYFYKNIDFTLTGNCLLIAKGYNGNLINDVMYSSPYPVILIKGNMELIWIGYNKDNLEVSQTINYVDGKWFIGEIKTK